MYEIAATIVIQSKKGGIKSNRQLGEKLLALKVNEEKLKLTKYYVFALSECEPTLCSILNKWFITLH